MKIPHRFMEPAFTYFVILFLIALFKIVSLTNDVNVLEMTLEATVNECADAWLKEPIEERHRKLIEK